MDQVLRKYEPDIKNFGYVTEALDYAIYNATDEYPSLGFTDLAKTTFQGTGAQFGINPSDYFDSSFVVSYRDDKDTGLGVSEELYTARGAQGMGLEDSIVSDLNLKNSDPESTFLFFCSH